jgi:hypothetical protein
MNWFDRLARSAADGSAISTRRGLLKGAAAVTAVASFGPALALGAERRAPASARPGCEACIAEALAANHEKIEACTRKGGSSQRLATASGKKGLKKYPIPAEVARRMACRSKARKDLGGALGGCANTSCESPGVEKELPPEVTAHATCPEGTFPCTKNMCCAGGDACCLCPSAPEGYICCAGVIGCTCCG